MFQNDKEENRILWIKYNINGNETYAGQDFWAGSV